MKLPNFILGSALQKIKNFLRNFLVDFLFRKPLKTTDGISFNKLLYCHILPRIEGYNQTPDSFLELFSRKHDESFVKYDATKWSWELLSEGILPKGKKIIWAKRQRDAEKFGLNIGYSWDWLLSEMASSKNILEILEQTKIRDKILNKVIILNTCLQSSTYGFFNGDFCKTETITAPPKCKDKSFKREHSHYLACPKKKIEESEIKTALKHIREHGYEKVIYCLFCNHDMKQKINCFSEKNKPMSKNVFGFFLDDFSGKITTDNDEVLCFEESWMPDRYFLFLAVKEWLKPLVFIEKKNPAIRGLILCPGQRLDEPLVDSAFIHWLNAMVLERGAGVVLYLGRKYKDPKMKAYIIEHNKFD